MKYRRLGVTMIIQAYLPHIGGAEQQLAALAPRLRERNIHMQVITRQYPGMSRREVIDKVPIFRLPVPGPKAIASLIFTFSALFLLRRLKPDLIHAHELLSPTTTAAAAKQQYGVPVVAKVLRGGQLGDLAKLKKRTGGVKRIQTFKELVDGFIVISQEIDQELDAWGIPQHQRFFIPNGVDTNRFEPVGPEEKTWLRQRLRLPNGPLALFTGRLVPEKCLDQLIHLWPHVRASYPQAQIVFLGTGPEETKLRRMAGEGVTFVGHTSDVVPYLQAADLFILPSFTEGLSNAMLEAMATGLPVIATHVGGAPDVITHKQNGWLIPPQQPECLHNAIITLFTLNDLRFNLGEQGRRRIEAGYSLDVTAERLVTLYERFIP
ncbi:MAG: glycosyltransferase family 4 protein [Chloroflexi bacterium]|nr:glycosyltransferase family 4 protein [Chloroflexota bacterium]MBP8055667.1 glycosyltransferase family 4 protein [Chloroflexota bacterium]